MEKSLAIWQIARCGDHPAAAQSYHNLATLYIEAEKYEQAEEALLSSRQILEKDRDSNQMHLATVFETLSGLYKRMGKERESNEYAARSLKIRKPEQMGNSPAH